MEALLLRLLDTDEETAPSLDHVVYKGTGAK